MTTRLASVSLLLASSLWSHGANSMGTVTLTTQGSVIAGKRNQGWWSPTVAHSSSNYLYLTGTYGRLGGGPYSPYRSHLSFNLAGVTDEVIGAKIMVTRFASVGKETQDRNGVPINDIHSGVIQTLSVYDVTTSAVTLNTFSGISAEIFDDLGSGRLLGMLSTPQFHNIDEVLEIELNAEAVSEINKNDGYFSVGLVLDSNPAYNNYLFMGTGGAYNGVQSLVLTTVPEPTTALAVLMAFPVCFWRRRKIG